MPRPFFFLIAPSLAGRTQALSSTKKHLILVSAFLLLNAAALRAQDAAPSDIQASITQSLTALRGAAPHAVIDLIVPFGQFGAQELRQGLAAYQAKQPDSGVHLLDLGPDVAAALGAGNYWGSLHPDMRGHAVIASRLIALIEPTLQPVSP
jgi:hypothetical protein